MIFENNIEYNGPVKDFLKAKIRPGLAVANVGANAVSYKIKEYSKAYIEEFNNRDKKTPGRVIMVRLLLYIQNIRQMYRIQVSRIQCNIPLHLIYIMLYK